MTNYKDITGFKSSVNKAVILSRVSTKEQEEGYSIAAQRHRLEQYCERKGLKVLQIFDLVESSTKGSRKAFMEMIKFVKKQRSPIAIVADKVDRVQRSFKEFPMLDQLVQAGKIELHFNTENYIIHKDSVSQERLMWSIGVVMAQSYVDSLRDNVKRSFDQKIRQGEWIGVAPIGYLNAKDEHGRSTVILDPERAPLMRKVFEEYATGNYSLHTLAEYTKKIGLINLRGNKSYMNRSQLNYIMRNPFYYGAMRIKGKLYPHVYDKLISKQLFEQCEAVRTGWCRKPHNYNIHEFIFKGLVHCSVRKGVAHMDQKRRTNKSGYHEWNYVIVGDPDRPKKKMWIREEDLLEMVTNAFRELHVPEHLMEDVYNYIKQTNQHERDFHRKRISGLKKEYTEQQNKLDKLMDLFIDEAITKDEHDRKKLQLKERQQAITLEIEEVTNADDIYRETVTDLVSIASQAPQLFNKANLKQKRRLINFAFSNLTLTGRNLQYTWNKPFDLFAKSGNCPEWLGWQDSNLRMAIPKTAALPLGYTPTTLWYQRPAKACTYGTKEKLTF